MEFVLCKEKKIWQNCWHSKQINWIEVTKPEKIDFHNVQSHGREAATGQKIAPWHPDWENPAYLKQAGKVDIDDDLDVGVDMVADSNIDNLLSHD